MSDQVIEHIGGVLLISFVILFVIPPYFKWQRVKYLDYRERKRMERNFK